MSDKSDRNKKFRNKRQARDEPKLNLDRFAGSSEDEDAPQKRKAGNHKEEANNNPLGKRAAKRARKKLAQQKQREEAAKEKGQRATKASPASGWQLKGGVVAKDVQVGAGKPAKPGCRVSITYEGYFPGKPTNKFDSNLDKNNPLQFTIGALEVVEGMELGVAGMKVGGTRIITIPPKMGYGEEGSPPEIPGGATLEFRVDLISFEPA